MYLPILSTEKLALYTSMNPFMTSVIFVLVIQISIFVLSFKRHDLDVNFVLLLSLRS